MDSKLIRKDLGMTQKEFAEKYGIPLTTVKNWDSRDCMPTYLCSVFAEIVALRLENDSLKNAIKSFDFVREFVIDE